MEQKRANKGKCCHEILWKHENNKPKNEISILTQNENLCHPTTSAFGICSKYQKSYLSNFKQQTDSAWDQLPCFCPYIIGSPGKFVITNNDSDEY